MYITKCIKEGNPCQRHINGKYQKWACGSEYSSSDRHAIFVSKKKPCLDCGNLCTAKYCIKCRGKHYKSHLLGKKLPQWWRDRISQGQGRGENNKKWKGEKVDYWTKHKGLITSNGNPKKCEDCGINGKKNKGNRWTIQWANITGTYTRDIKDYKGLCTKCHKIFDGLVKDIDEYKHGSPARYRRGCRCDNCREAKKLYRNGKLSYMNCLE